MTSRAYISNLSPAWPISRQEALLAAAIPGWPAGVRVFRDVLEAKARQGHSTALLVERGKLLRLSSRGAGETILIAALPVFAWGADDLLSCITAAAARNATLRVLDVGLTILPTSTAADLHTALTAFATSRRRALEQGRASIGGQVSAAKRSGDAKAAAETIRAQWALPSDDYPTLALLDKAGISRNTAKLYLGKRSDAQRIHQAGLKRAATKRGRDNEPG